VLLDQLICGGVIKVFGGKKKDVNSFDSSECQGYLPRGRPSSVPRYARMNVAKLVTTFRSHHSGLNVKNLIILEGH
jgi:hypothetical protein